MSPKTRHTPPKQKKGTRKGATTKPQEKALSPTRDPDLDTPVIVAGLNQIFASKITREATAIPILGLPIVDNPEMLFEN